jgi:hypothetical protein
MLRDPAFSHKVTVILNPYGIVKNMLHINDAVMDMFGLPGDRYLIYTTKGIQQLSIVSPGIVITDYYFKDTHDLLLFKLKFSEAVHEDA